MVRLGIAGVGTIANDYIGLIAGGKVKDVSITAFCSRNETHIQEVKKKYGLASWTFTDYDEMIRSGTIDAVLICTPHTLHPSMTRTALENGVHVLVEKPVGIYADEVADILPILNEHPDLVCGVMYNRRASKAYRYLQETVQSGILGELVRCSWIITNLYRTEAYYKSGSWRGTWKGEGGGLLMTQASHQLDLMQWICGMPVSVYARCSTVNRPVQVENEAELMFEYSNGAHGHFIASAHECPGTNMLEICGTKGRISVENDSDVKVILLEEDERTFAKICHAPFEKVPGKEKHFIFDDSDNKVQQASTIQNFISAVENHCPIQCSLEEGLHSLQIIHGAYLSQWTGKPVSLPVCEQMFSEKIRGL